MSSPPTRKSLGRRKEFKMKRTLLATTIVIGAMLMTCGCAKNASTACTACPACSLCTADAQAVCPIALDDATTNALRAALTDERQVQAFYTAVMDRHGKVRPFINIAAAESRHEAAVVTLMNRHGIEVPPRTGVEAPAVPDTLAESARVAAQLERDNIAMYDRLLNDVTAPDVRQTMQALRSASLNNHLPAFERVSSRGAAAQAGGGYGGGWGRGAGPQAGRGYGRGRGPGAGWRAASGLCPAPCGQALCCGLGGPPR